MKTVLLSGCGNIGFRHLQALCAMSVPVDITVVEPNSELHDRIHTQFTDGAASGHRFHLVTALPTEAGHFDLAVVATTAQHRRAVVEHILAHHDVPVMILEKVLFQTVADLDAVDQLLDRRGVTAFVNCGRRTFEGYQAMRRQMEDEGPVHVTVRGQRIGLASNAVHFLDLAEFLNNASITDVDTAGLLPGSTPGRRPGVVEIFGVLRARLSNGALLTIASLDIEPIAISLSIDGTTSSVQIDELARTVRIDDRDPTGFKSQNVSETPGLYQDALDSGRCVLTPYRNSVRQHRLYLRAVNAHLGLGDDVSCPIS